MVVRERMKWYPSLSSAVTCTCAGPAGATGVSAGGAPPAAPGDVPPEPGVEPGTTGAGTVVHGALDAGELAPLDALFGSEGFAPKPRLWLDFFPA